MHCQAPFLAILHERRDKYITIWFDVWFAVCLQPGQTLCNYFLIFHLLLHSAHLVLNDASSDFKIQTTTLDWLVTRYLLRLISTLRPLSWSLWTLYPFVVAYWTFHMESSGTQSLQSVSYDFHALTFRLVTKYKCGINVIYCSCRFLLQTFNPALVKSYWNTFVEKTAGLPFKRLLFNWFILT